MKKFLFFIHEVDNDRLYIKICISEGKDLEEAKLNLVKTDRIVSLNSLDNSSFVELNASGVSSIESTLQFNDRLYLKEISALYLRDLNII